MINQNSIQSEIKCRLKSDISCYHSILTHLFSRLLSKNLNIKLYKTIRLPVVLHLKRGLLYQGINAGKQDPEPKRNADGCRLGFKMKNFIVCTVHLIELGWWNLVDWNGQVM